MVQHAESRLPLDDVELREEGETHIRDMSAQVDRISDSITAALSEEEVAQLDDLLRRCAKQIEEDLRREYPGEPF